jgi:hypothetical protein
MSIKQLTVKSARRLRIGTRPRYRGISRRHNRSADEARRFDHVLIQSTHSSARHTSKKIIVLPLPCSRLSLLTIVCLFCGPMHAPGAAPRLPLHRVRARDACEMREAPVVDGHGMCVSTRSRLPVSVGRKMSYSVR